MSWGRSLREARIGKPAGSGPAGPAVVTAVTSWPRSARKRPSSGPCEAGPPTSGGQMPEEIRTRTIGSPLDAARVGHSSDSTTGADVRPLMSSAVTVSSDASGLSSSTGTDQRISHSNPES